MPEPSISADVTPVRSKERELTTEDVQVAQAVWEQHVPSMVTHACLACDNVKWPCQPYRRAEQVMLAAGVLDGAHRSGRLVLHHVDGHAGEGAALLACASSQTGIGEEQRVSKIDETIGAIQAAMSQLNETRTAIGTAGGEADDAQSGAAALGADGVAQAMSQCREALDKASGACASVSDALEEAVSAAQSAAG